jgi:hypothetical protein
LRGVAFFSAFQSRFARRFSANPRAVTANHGTIMTRYFGPRRISTMPGSLARTKELLVSDFL